jgi:AraC-like DNA-binding protein
MKREEFITKKPNSPFLQQYISYYYFHNSLGNYESKKYIYYPNIKSALTIYKNSKVTFSDKYSRTEPDTKTDFSFLYSGIQKQLRTSEIIAPFNKIGIVFNELGINHFIKQPLSSITIHPVDKQFNHFGNDFINSCESIYNTKELDEKINLLDIFFESKFCDFQNKKFKDCIHTIVSSKDKLTVTELSEKLQINKKTLLRLFKNHLCCTTKEYLNIVQFRKSLNDYLLVNKKSSLTELALDSQYYDQSQFINHFKKLSGKNPKTFFKNIEHIGDEDIFWTFL